MNALLLNYNWPSKLRYIPKLLFQLTSSVSSTTAALAGVGVVVAINTGSISFDGVDEIGVKAEV